MNLRKKILTLLALIITLNLSALNWGFENGNFSDWDMYYGTNNRKKLLFLPICISNGISGVQVGQNSPNYHKIETNGFDPILGGNLLPKTIEGNFSVRLGSNNVSKQASRISKRFQVTNSAPFLKVNYALVMKDPGHNKCRQPYFQIAIKNSSGNIIFIETIVANNNDPYFKKHNGFIYKDWDCKNIDLANFIGENLEVVFTTVNCSVGNQNHFSYAYLDGINKEIIEPIFTTNKSTYCNDEPVMADATQTKGEIDFFWSIQESDEYWNGISGTEVSKWFTAQQAGNINLSELYKELGGNFKCNTFYRIKLAVKNNCVSWKETTKLINVSCPTVDAGKDLCCSNLTSLPVIGETNINPNYTYEWFPKYGLSTPNSPQTFVDCNNEDINEFDCFNYTLKATDQYGCVLEDEVRVFFGKPKFNIIQSIGCCNNRLTVQGDGCSTSYLWSTGETSKSISITSPGTYSVTVSNACGNTIKSIQVNSLPAENLIKNLWDNSNKGFWYSNGTNVNSDNAFMITHVQDPPPNSGIYFATEYKLEIFNRWGNLIHTITDEISSCNGFNNNQIRWDGKINGQKVQSGIYNARLYLKNCFHNSQWIPIEITYCNGYDVECLDLRCEGGLGFSCGFFKIWKCYKIGKICNDERRHLIFPIDIEF